MCTSVLCIIGCVAGIFAKNRTEEMTVFEHFSNQICSVSLIKKNQLLGARHVVQPPPLQKKNLRMEKCNLQRGKNSNIVSLVAVLFYSLMSLSRVLRNTCFWFFCSCADIKEILKLALNRPPNATRVTKGGKTGNLFFSECVLGTDEQEDKKR